jgi:hypothetical protein
MFILIVLAIPVCLANLGSQTDDRSNELDAINEIVLQFEDERSVIKTQGKINARKKQLEAIKQLRQMQDNQTRAGKIDFAVSIRTRISTIKENAFGRREWSSIARVTSTGPMGEYYGHIPSPPYPYSRSPAIQAINNEPLPEDAAQMIAKLDEDLSIIERDAKAKIKTLKANAIPQLRILLGASSKAGNLPIATHAREAIQYLEQGYLHPVKINYSLMELRPVIGNVYFVEVTCRVAGALYGTDSFTSDSSIPSAAIQLGLAKPGETVILKVTVLPGQASFEGSTRNGVTSSSYGPYSMAFKLERADD